MVWAKSGICRRSPIAVPGWLCNVNARRVGLEPVSIPLVTTQTIWSPLQLKQRAQSVASAIPATWCTSHVVIVPSIKDAFAMAFAHSAVQTCPMQGIAPRLSAVGEEVFCLDCLPESRDHVSADWFLRLCLINGVEWSVDPELGDCVICTDRMTAMDSIEVLCCSRSPTWFVLLDLSLHVGCITFCNQSLAVFCQVFLFHWFLYSFVVA